MASSGVELTFTDTCCMDKHRDVHTQSHNHKHIHRNTQDTLAPGNTLNHTKGPTDTKKQTYACAHVCMYTHTQYKHI